MFFTYRSMRWFALIAVLALFASCSTVGSVDSELTIRNLDIITTRTLRYIDADPNAPDGLRLQIAQSDAALRVMAQQGERVPAMAAKARVDAICDVHDRYVTADAALDPIRKGHYLRTTQLFRQVYAEGAGGLGTAPPR